VARRCDATLRPGPAHRVSGYVRSPDGSRHWSGCGWV